MNIETWFVVNEVISQTVHQKRYWIIPVLLVVLIAAGYIGYTLSERHISNTVPEKQSIEEKNKTTPLEIINL